MLTNVINNQSIPTLKAKDKMPKNLFHAHIDARNLIESISGGLGSHLLENAKNHKIRTKLDVVTPKIILPGQ